MHRAYLTRNTDRVRVTGTPSPGSVAPASFINTVDRVNPSTWSHFPVRPFSRVGRGLGTRLNITKPLKTARNLLVWASNRRARLITLVVYCQA